MQINDLFLGFARSLGAEAHVLALPDRTDHFWDPSRLDSKQFNGWLVLVGAKGEPTDKASIVAPGAGLPWGEIPWWLTDTRGLLGTATGSERVFVPSPPAGANVVDRKVEIAFKGEDGVQVRWTRKASGQSAYSDRNRLMAMSPEERSKKLEQICGSSSRLEIVRASGSNVEKLRLPFEVSCEGTMNVEGPTESGTYEFVADGPWTAGIPELKAATRIHPIVFDFPHVDQTVIDVTAPEGFKPKGGVPSLELKGGVWTYAFTVSTTRTGYHIVRSFTMAAPGIAIASYPNLRTFMNQAELADKTKLVFERKAGTK